MSDMWNDVLPRVDADKCRRCPDCPPADACLVRALRRDGASLPRPEPGLCFGCYTCAVVCPHGAILMPRTPASGWQEGRELG